MSVLQANCPSSAAPVEFQAGSTIVLVCPFCRSAIARTDRGLSDLGKVAEIADSQSPLKLGLKGIWKDTRFELTGRAQLAHELGGFWDEWYATFSNGWVGWLAEAQGRFYLTFYQPLPQGVTLPSFVGLQLGQFVNEIPSQSPLMVQEKGAATAVAADGEIPYQFTPGEKGSYADLAGKGGAFGTIDYSLDPPWVFVGQQVTLEEIGLGHAKPVTREARKVSAVAMGCPNCGGPLDLVAPDKTERVTCPNCDSLLEVNQGNLSFLRALTPPPAEQQFLLPVGLEGTIGDAKYKIIGAMIRSVTFEGIKYFWHEYLLYNPMIGFRWMVHSDNQWNFVETVNPADVEQAGYIGAGASVKYGGNTYKIFQDAPASVEYIKGEFYWRVEQGETVARAVDYVSPPRMLSLEMTGNEMNWSLGTYMTNAEVEKTFGVASLPRPWGVAPNQPFTGRFYYTWGFLPLFLLLVVGFIMVVLSGFASTPYSETVTLQPPSAPTTPTSSPVPQVVFSQPFDIKGNSNVRISASAPVNNAEADLDVDLINEQNQEVESVSIPISYYQGVEDGESWSEGSTSNDATLSALPAGKYTLRVEGSLDNVQQPLPVSLKVEQNVNRGVNFCCAGLVLLIIPVLNLFRKITFESRRWKDSMFGSSASGGSDDSDDSSYSSDD